MFTKLLKPVIGLLRRLGIRMLIFLDDLLLLNQSRTDLIVDMNSTIWLLEHLGFLINWKKSVMIPSQKLEYLGFLVDSKKMSLSLPEDKIVKIQLECQLLLEQDIVSARCLSKLIGRLTSTVLAILPAPLHYRQLQMLRSKALLRGGVKIMAQLFR